MANKKNVFLATSQELVKVAVDDLKIGMYIDRLDRSWLDTPFLFQGFELKKQQDIDAVRKYCEYVYVDATRKYKVKQLSIEENLSVNDGLLQRKRVGSKNKFSPHWLKDRTPPKSVMTFEQEIARAEHIHGNSSDLVKNFMDEVSLGHTINAEIAKKAVSECVDSVLHSPDALLWMTQLKSRDEYTSQHSLNVCILAIALGRQIDLSVEELNHLGLCGMMHDMGKMRVPLEVLNKPGKLTPAEQKLMRSHTTLGWKLLMSSSGMYGGAIDVAYTHHERIDGKGYPRQLSEEQISPYARMVAIVDMYDAITSNRVYHDGKTHLEAINILTKARGTHLDSALTIKFIECLGIYPPGSIVELNNGEIAIVVEVNHNMKIRPKIIMLLDEDKAPVPERLVDLSKMDLDSSGQNYRIKKIVSADTIGINIRKYYVNGLLRRGLSAI